MLLNFASLQVLSGLPHFNSYMYVTTRGKLFILGRGDGPDLDTQKSYVGSAKHRYVILRQRRTIRRPGNFLMPNGNRATPRNAARVLTETLTVGSDEICYNYFLYISNRFTEKIY